MLLIILIAEFLQNYKRYSEKHCEMMKANSEKILIFDKDYVHLPTQPRNFASNESLGGCGVVFPPPCTVYYLRH